MCGIAGYFSTEKVFDPSSLKDMCESLKHRGPDAEGIYHDEICGLAHRRLSIIDLSTAANQPMFSDDKRYVIAFNGEVYNYRDIQKEQKLQLRTTSDTEVILQMFIREGKNCVRHFNGMFAIAIYDTVERKLTLIRDRLGVKPLLYFWDGNHLAFGSDFSSLLTLPFVRRNVKLNARAINEYLHLGYIPQPDTIYDRIHKLPAGGIATIDVNGMNIASYWNPESAIKMNVIQSREEALERVRTLLSDSIRYRMISDVPFGTFLSGGIDSSLVTAIAQESSSTPVKTFTIGFKEQAFNEADYARKVATHLGTEHHEFIVSYDDALKLVEQIIPAYGEPYADSSAIPTMLVSKLARTNVKMILSGEGGDELFKGYGTYTWAGRLREPGIHRFRKPMAAILQMGGEKYRKASRILSYPSAEQRNSHLFSQEHYFFMRKESRQILNPDWQSEFELEENFQVKRILTPEEEQALFDIKYYLRDDLLVKADRASMQYGLETRTPFLDYRLVELALNISPQLKLRNQTLKYLSKEILYTYLPKEYFDRPKKGFAIPLKQWLQGPLKHLVDESLSRDAVKKHGILNPDAVEKICRDFRNGKDYLYTRIWSLLMLQKFLESK